ncbi:hypothetical protein EVAR_53399_1 [Eumeta japonica]|uniref:Uncharacterized protein n=1 Tax=Eumeta variegata TaxID=151549 RepID=A0A4C1XT55_EUMVA|nr:hypothetical protein EVAR_53399_1 [Eumeta japonica]
MCHFRSTSAATSLRFCEAPEDFETATTNRALGYTRKRGSCIQLKPSMQWNIRNSAALNCLRMMQCACSARPNPSPPRSYFTSHCGAFVPNFTTAEFRQCSSLLCGRTAEVELGGRSSSALALALLRPEGQSAPCTLRLNAPDASAFTLRLIDVKVVFEENNKLEINQQSRYFGAHVAPRAPGRCPRVPDLEETELLDRSFKISEVKYRLACLGGKVRLVYLDGIRHDVLLCHHAPTEAAVYSVQGLNNNQPNGSVSGKSPLCVGSGA